uniref:Uncharacterized protein n=1 Tax=Zea mays TaxID=4577 RepID=A0A804RJB5_MAIZE
MEKDPEKKKYLDGAFDPLDFSKLQGHPQAPGVQTQGDQERPPRHAGLRRLLHPVGVPGHRPAREPRRPPRRPLAQQHR